MKAKARATALPTRNRTRDAEGVRPSEQKKLSFKDKHALETLPAKMDATRARIEELKSAIGDPALYARDPKRFATLTEELGRASTDLGVMEDRWLELEILRESLQG
jgi:ATP-binding cassette subfamily F protein uup